MEIDAIVSDLDDTLLNAESALSPYTLSVLERAKARGVRIIPASGRTSRSMLRFVRQLDTHQPYIASNGGELVNADHTVLEMIAFTPEKARELIRFFKDHAFYVQCYRDNDFYFDTVCEASESYRKSSLMNAVAVGDLEAFIDFPTPKVLSVQTPAVVEAMYPVIQKAFPDVSFTISKPYFLEAQPENVSKGTALVRLAGKLGLTPEHTLVFGDSLNDVTMLQFAKHSVAMGNARDEVKQAARHVCGTNAEDGVAHFVERYVLS